MCPSKRRWLTDWMSQWALVSKWLCYKTEAAEAAAAIYVQSIKQMTKEEEEEELKELYEANRRVRERRRQAKKPEKAACQNLRATLLFFFFFFFSFFDSCLSIVGSTLLPLPLFQSHFIASLSLSLSFSLFVDFCFHKHWTNWALIVWTAVAPNYPLLNPPPHTNLLTTSLFFVFWLACFGVQQFSFVWGDHWRLQFVQKTVTPTFGFSQ